MKDKPSYKELEDKITLLARQLAINAEEKKEVKVFSAKF
ncbi:MAG: hypothetical protein ACI8RP_000075 [Urechidicola sp.]|jgi:hypothetical protein